jgi:hypothetical protein
MSSWKVQYCKIILASFHCSFFPFQSVKLNVTHTEVAHFIKNIKVKSFLENRVQNYQNYTRQRYLIAASYVRKNSLVPVIYRVMQVQEADKRRLVVKRLSHRPLKSEVQLKEWEILYGVFYAMCARDLLVALIWIIIPEYALENGHLYANCSRRSSLRVQS